MELIGLSVGLTNCINLATSSLPLALNKVLQMSHSKYNLLSIQRLCEDNNCEVNFDSSSVHIKDKAIGITLLQGTSDCVI